MNNQETLPHQSHSETSKEAATKAVNQAKSDRAHIYSLINKSGINGLTNDEISQKKGKNVSFYSPRLIELERAGDIFKLSQTRETRANKKANVYVTNINVGGREIIPVKKEGKMPDPIIEEMDKRVLREFVGDIISSRIVYKNGSVYNAIKRLAGV